MCAQCATHAGRPCSLPCLSLSHESLSLTVARVLARRLPRSAVVNDAPESPLRAQRWDDSGVTACPARSRGMPSSMGASAQPGSCHTCVVVLSCLPGVLRARLHTIARERPPAPVMHTPDACRSARGHRTSHCRAGRLPGLRPSRLRCCMPCRCCDCTRMRDCVFPVITS